MQSWSPPLAVGSKKRQASARVQVRIVHAGAADAAFASAEGRCPAIDAVAAHRKTVRLRLATSVRMTVRTARAARFRATRTKREDQYDSVAKDTVDDRRTLGGGGRSGHGWMLGSRRGSF